MNRMIFGIGIVLAVLVAFTAPAAADSEVYFAPDSSTVSVAPGENVTIQIMADIGDIYPSETGIRYYQIGVDFDPSVVNITNVANPWVFEPYVTWWMQAFAWDNPSDENPGPIGAWIWVTGAHSSCYGAPHTVQIANLTIEGVSGGTSPLNFTRGIRLEPSRGDSRLKNCTTTTMTSVTITPTTWNNGTIECTGAAGPTESFTKGLVEGWNLISLPLTPLNKSTRAVLGNDTIEYDAVYRYNATSKRFEDVTTSTMDPGIGYFVNVTTAGTWTYDGSTAYNSMNIDLKQGLNMIGWLNCTKQISGNLSSIAGKYNYNARWNAGYEVYEPHAPEVFNDFEMMERGEGYWIAATEDCTLAESCSG